MQPTWCSLVKGGKAIVANKNASPLDQCPWHMLILILYEAKERVLQRGIGLILLAHQYKREI